MFRRPPGSTATRGRRDLVNTSAAVLRAVRPTAAAGYGHPVDGEGEPGPVEDVITTAIALVSGRLAPREAVTILASLAPTAVRAAPGLLARSREGAMSRAAVLRALAAEVGAGEDDAGQRRRVVDDLTAVAAALAAEPGTV